jgi:ABC-type nitrate/sulfonate/bicarbonate transport system substrate-binding protein
MNRNSKILAGFAGVLILAAIAAYAWLVAREPGQSTVLTTVRFGMIPYGDHTYAIIGVKKGWFKDVGVDLQYKTIRDEQVVPFLQNGSYDVVSTSPGILLAGYDHAPDLGMFVFGTIFQGYAIMAQPDGHYKTYAQFVAAGLSPQAAIKATVDQMQGKVFAYPAEGGIQPFVHLVLQSGDLTRKDFTALVADDPVAVNDMRTKRADFQVGGAPSRVTLQREGFVPIISAIDFVRATSAHADPSVLTAVFPDGWGTTLSYYKSHHDIVLRLASVDFRIINYILQHPKDALAIQLPYLEQVTGQKFTTQDGLIIYKYLDPFVSFDQQASWFESPSDPLYVDRIFTAHIASFKAQGQLRSGTPSLQKLVLAKAVYEELKGLRAQSDALRKRLQVFGLNRLSADQHKRYLEGESHFEGFDFLDSNRSFQSLVNELGA